MQMICLDPSATEIRTFAVRRSVVQKRFASVTPVLTKGMLFFVYLRLFFFFLAGYVEERLWWPIQSPT